MPLVRISHSNKVNTAVRNTLSVGVHRALLTTFDVPEDDYFQVITEHTEQDGLLGPHQFLGIAHTNNLVFVQITCSPGRSIEKKRALYSAIAKNLSTDTGVRVEDIIINLVETARENWSFGNGIASYAVAI